MLCAQATILHDGDCPGYRALPFNPTTQCSRSKVLKAVLRIGRFTLAILLLVVPHANADEVTFDLNEGGPTAGGLASGSGVLLPDGSTVLNQVVDNRLGTYQFTGNVRPARTGLIGVSTGFRAVVSRFVEGFSIDRDDGAPLDDFGPMLDDGDIGDLDPGPPPTTEWTRIQVDTRAAGTFSRGPRTLHSDAAGFGRMCRLHPPPTLRKLADLA